MDELLRLVTKMHLNKDDLIMEAETLENYGEYLHISLMGFSADMFRALAERMEG